MNLASEIADMRRALVTVLIGMAGADREFHPEENDLLRRKFTDLGLTNQESTEVRTLLGHPPDPWVLTKFKLSPDFQVYLVGQAYLMMLADRKQGPPEIAFYNRLLTAFNLSEKDVAGIEKYMRGLVNFRLRARALAWDDPPFPGRP